MAWLNLDFGFESCFYDGMDMYQNTWLQFLFPLYIWVLIVIVIVSSRFSSWVTRKLGTNPVAVLATLVLLSYNKILHTVVFILSSTHHRELNYITHIGGGKGSGPGQFSRPYDIAWDSSSLYVADEDNGRIQVFDEDGRYVREFGQRGSGHGELLSPCYIDVARDLVYVSEFGNNRVSVFDTSGRFVCTVGREGSGPGELRLPCGISVRGKGLLEQFQRSQQHK